MDIESKRGGRFDRPFFYLILGILYIDVSYSTSVVRSTPWSCALLIVLHGVSTTQ